MNIIMNKIKYLWSKKFIYLFSLIFFFFVGYFISNQINLYNDKLICDFSSNITINANELITINNLNTIKNSAEKYDDINVEKMLDNNDFYLVNIGEDNYQIITYGHYYNTFFLKSELSMSTRGKKFIEDLLYTYIGQDHIEFKYETVITTKNVTNPLIIGGSVAGSSFILITILLLIFKPINDEQFYDYEKTFPTPFYKAFWKDAKSFLSSIRSITAISMLFALMLLSKLIFIPSGFANLGLSFGYLFFSLIGLIFGPYAGLLIGFLSDTIGYFIGNNSAPFFIGYVFQAMITGLIYGLFFYKTKITFARTFFVRLLVSLLCNVIIGGICWGIISNYTAEQTIVYMLVASLPKNIIYLIPQSILLYIVFKGVLPLLGRSKLIDEKISKNISLI